MQSMILHIKKNCLIFFKVIISNYQPILGQNFNLATISVFETILPLQNSFIFEYKYARFKGTGPKQVFYWAKKNIV
jgi:hypothetical protein